MAWYGPPVKPSSPGTHLSPVLLQAATHPTGGLNCVLNFERVEWNSHSKRVSLLSMSWTIQMSHDVTEFEGFLCDNTTKTGMMIKGPVYVHKHTYTTYIPILLTADSTEKCSKIQEIQSSNTTNKHNLHAPNTHDTRYQKDMYHAETRLHVYVILPP